MKTSYIKQNFHLFVFGIAVFSILVVLINISLAQELNEPENVYNRDKAIEIVSRSENGGPGGCKTEAACDAYCGSNQGACMDWALSNGVISQENYDKYNGFSKKGGPGGCKTENECKAYCEVEGHFDECLGFAEREGIISADDAARARKTGPGGCKTEKECRAFCENPQNQEVCLDVAVREGFMSADEAQRVREFQKTAEKFKNKAEEFKKRAEEKFGRPKIDEVDPGFNKEKAEELLKTKAGPGGCKTIEACELFCDQPSNQEACFQFAEDEGLFRNKEQAEKIKKIIKTGGPGGCRGENECHNFCEKEVNFETCIGFAEKEGFLPPEELEKAKKGIKALKEGGPAGCKTKETCETVCQDPANQEACFDWAKKNGLISEEEVKFMEEANKFRKEFEQRRSEFGGSADHPDGGFRGPSQFPGRSGEFPGKPPSGEFSPGQIPPGFEKEFEKRFPEGFSPSGKSPEGGQTPESFRIPEGFKQPEGFHPPEGFQIPEGFQPPHGSSPSGGSPEGGQPPAGFQQQYQQQYQHKQQQYQQPPAEFQQTAPPPLETTQPQTLLQYSPFGVILKFFLGQ